MKKHLFLMAGLAFVMSACVDNIIEEPGEFGGSEVVRVTCEADNFISEDFMTRSSAEVSDPDNLGFTWNVADTVGIFPSTGDQISFPMAEGAGTASANFDGGGWALKNSATYYAYYPFSRNNFDSNKRVTKIPYTYTGQKAVFEDEDGLVNIGAFDYMYALPCTPENGSANFWFKHLGALARMVVTFPETAVYKTLRITASGKIFPVEGTFDLTAENASFAPTKYSSTLDIDLVNLSGTAGKSAVVYFMLPPVDMTVIESVAAALIDSNMNEQRIFIQRKKVEAGKAYDWKVNMVPSNLSANGYANCYIVPSDGPYKFKPAKGNSSASVGTISKVEVLWESFGTNVTPKVGDLISEISYSGGYISFVASDRKGNALVAAKDASGKILWSWHIWLTDKPKDVVLYNNAGTMMDRNLGATSVTPGDVKALGLYYQWGRKDPFMGKSTIEYGSNANRELAKATYESDFVFCSSSTSTIEYATSHPTTLLVQNNSFDTSKDWLALDLSSSNSEQSDRTRWQSSKTIYDPCPNGYRITEAGTDGIWAKMFGLTTDDRVFRAYEFDSVNKGYDFGKKNSLKSVTDEESFWFPISEGLYLYELYGDNMLYHWGADNYGLIWTCTSGATDSSMAELFYYDATMVNRNGWFEKSKVFPVRCQKI